MDPIRREFDKMNPAWEPNPEFNLYFLRCQEAYFNHKLQARGHVFLNEVYDALGFIRTRQGAVVGWTLGPEKTGYVSFGLPNQLSGQLQESFTLEFNVDGNIIESLEDA